MGSPPPPSDTQTDLERLQSTRLYKAYAGVDDRSLGRKFRFTLGLGIALAVLILGVGAGGYFAFNTFQGIPENPDATPGSRVEAPPTHPAPSGENPEATSPHTAPSPGAASGGGSREQVVNAANRWAENSPLGRSPTSVRARIDAQWDPGTGHHQFAVRVTPDASGLNMASRAVLFRAPEPEGPFTQVDAAKASSIDEAGALVYTLFDGQGEEFGKNRAWYRILGEDADGRRLFDTPSAEFPVLPPMQVRSGRLMWKPASTQEPMPPIRAVVTAAAPGWEGVVLAQVIPSGPVDMALPGGRAKLPMKVTLRTYQPVLAEATSREAQPWHAGPQEHVIEQTGSASSSPAGLVPTWSEGRLTYRAIPADTAFAEVRESADESGGVRVTLRPRGGADAVTLAFPAPPAPQGVVATPFDRAVRITWDAGDLADSLSAFEGDVVISVFRHTEDGRREVVAMLPVTHTSFTDSGVSPGVPVAYDVRVTSRQSADVPASLKADAYIAGVGTVPVLVDATPGEGSVFVMAEPGVTRLHVVLGGDELCHPGSDLAAHRVRQALREALAVVPGVGIIEREALTLTASRLPEGRGQTGRTLRGAPAHLQLRLVDTADREGSRIEVWCLDLVGQEQWKVGEVAITAMMEPGGAADLGDAVAAMARARAPEPVDEEMAPATRIVMGALLPIDEDRRYYGCDTLAASLVGAARKGGVILTPVGQLHGFGEENPLDASGTVVLTGRAWCGSGLRPGLQILAVEASTGRRLATFQADEVGPDQEKAFVAWCGELQTPAPSLRTLTSGADSVLLRREAGLPIVSGAFRRAEEAAGGTRPTPQAPPPMASNVVTFSFGLSLPAALANPPGSSPRASEDPLCIVRPYIVQPSPLMATQWIDAYGEYLKADYDSYKVGLDVVNLTLRERGAVVPRFIVRGREGPMATDPLPARAISMPGAELLNLQGLFPSANVQGALVSYRTDLEAQFRRRPYASYQAWKRVPRELSEPFLKSIVMGVQNGQYGKLDFSFDRPPDFTTYLAARALEDMGVVIVANWRKKAHEVAVNNFRELLQRPGVQLDPYKQQSMSQLILILLFEKDQQALTTFTDLGMLTAYLRLDPEPAADALRLVVDRLGAAAWQWARKQTILWDHFLWADETEMRTISDAMPEALPQPLYKAMRVWLDAPVLAVEHTPAPPSPTELRTRRNGLTPRPGMRTPGG